jgi:hypothetical protein
MKIMPFKNAMKKAGMRLVYGGRHAVYKKTVEGKTFCFFADLLWI